METQIADTLKERTKSPASTVKDAIKDTAATSSGHAESGHVSMRDEFRQVSTSFDTLGSAGEPAPGQAVKSSDKL